MRTELLYNPLAFLQRVGEWAATRRRLRRLRGTAGASLQYGHIDSLELLDLSKKVNPQVIFDIGANIGTWTLLAKALYPQAEIHAFEPLPAHAKHFQFSLRGIERVELHQAGLGAANGNAILHVTDFSDASSVLKMSEAGRSQWNLSEVQEIALELWRLDDFVARYRLPQPDLMKIDVQGFELEVLKGAPSVLAKTRAVITEVSFHEFYRGQCRFDQLVSFLAEDGLFVSAFGARTPVGNQLVQSDVLFLRS
jgi:FkbM family methyltransferase